MPVFWRFSQAGIPPGEACGAEQGGLAFRQGLQCGDQALLLGRRLLDRRKVTPPERVTLEREHLPQAPGPGELGAQQFRETLTQGWRRHSGAPEA